MYDSILSHHMKPPHLDEFLMFLIVYRVSNIHFVLHNYPLFTHPFHSKAFEFCIVILNYYRIMLWLLNRTMSTTQVGQLIALLVFN